MKKAKLAFLTAISTVLLFVATASSVFACTVLWHQPETPKSLIK